jgi:hypothetical protein
MPNSGARPPGLTPAAEKRKKIYVMRAVPHHERPDPDSKKIVYLELLSAGMILFIVILVLAMVFLYKPAG